MKVCYIFREKERKAHSIELLFDTISREVQATGVQIEKWYKPLSNLKAILSLRKLNADIYHITGDCYYLSLFLPWNRTVMTVHDIGMYKNHPKTLKRRIFAFVSFILPMKLLKFCTAISELTRDDLVNILGIDKNKICVIPNPLVHPLSYTPKDFNSECPTILQIGTGDHKNLIGLIRSVKNLQCKLDIVGHPADSLVKLMDDYSLSYSVSSNITNDQLLEKYRNCDIVYFASLSEGFGLPILEAQGVGRPVITSDLEPMRTICGGGGLLVDPSSHTQITEAIEKVTSNISLREQLLKRGQENVEKYKVKDIVNQYLNLYNNLKYEKHSLSN